MGPYDQNSLVGHHAVGDAERILGVRSRFGHNVVGGAPLFVRMAILEVISDPSVIDDSKLTHWEHDLNVVNIKYASVAPRNSIIAKRVLGNGTAASEKTMVLYPFFPPHLAFPAKPGEHVWAIFENPDAKVNELGYWMCRIVGPHFTEDVNYSHSDRQFDPSFVPGIAATFEGTDDPKYEFPNGVVDEKDGQRFIVGSTSTIPGDETAYETLLQETEASKTICYEAVPRYRKRPGDTAFEGTNNTLIVLGTDRIGPIADYDTDADHGKVPKVHVGDNPGQSNVGMIDIVVGRGQTDKTAGKTVTNKLSRKELGKSKKDLADAEGDPDLKNDRSRIMVSQKTKTDKNLGIDKVVIAHTSKVPVKDADPGNGSIIIKSDKVRLIARQDLVVLVTGALDSDKDTNGNIKDPDLDPDKCASITIRANGDIIFKPSALGYIKLGGDDADKGIVCSDIPVTMANGGVSGPPLTTTMGGLFAGSKPAGHDNGPALAPSQAKFANKVLVR